jgi:preprotein translocase subunit SecY
VAVTTRRLNLKISKDIVDGKRLGVLDALASIGMHIPGVPKPAVKPSLGTRFLYTFLAVAIYVLMASTPLYGIQHTAGAAAALPTIVQVVFASSQGTLAQLGIGPIVTAGLIMQILVGSKLIDLDLSKPEGRRKFTLAQKSLSLIIAGVEAGGFVIVGSNFWELTGPNPVFDVAASPLIRFFVWLQLVGATLLVILLDEMLQKGWGIGSGISLFILTGTAGVIVNDLFSPFPISTGSQEPLGFIPYLTYSLISGGLTIEGLFVRYNQTLGYLPALMGLLSFIVIAVVLIYLQRMKVYIPVTTQRLRGLKTRVPLQFLYVTNMPVLLVSILFADLLIFRAILSGTGASSILDQALYYLTPPRGYLELIADPTRVAVYTVIFTLLSLAFAFMWVEVAGLNPSGQAEKIIKSGLEIPGLRRNPKVLEILLGKYIYPLTLLSALIVVALVIIADLTLAYGSGVGILLSVGILEQYYLLIMRERAIEAYPALKKILGE